MSIDDAIEEIVLKRGEMIRLLDQVSQDEGLLITKGVFSIFLRILDSKFKGDAQPDRLVRESLHYIVRGVQVFYHENSAVTLAGVRKSVEHDPVALFIMGHESVGLNKDVEKPKNTAPSVVRVTRK
ncbi:hypothetical protein RF11_11807 [Thelohanellus kitauei]|uniref:Uncharacterized protein n=1 Tax=Thelohanellus kitauei TaxID=669202 RepID=A0A0C2NGC9_THEKT|nr:hypothetical protein RF11_11807 [Thelohanellus kitauei]